MRVRLAHLREPSIGGGNINYAVFDARSTSGFDRDNDALLARLTAVAQRSGLRIDQSALVFMENGRTKFYGSRPLVQHLSRTGLRSGWTHSIELERDAAANWPQQDNKAERRKIDRVFVSYTESYEVSYFVDEYLRTRGIPINAQTRAAIRALMDRYPGRAPVMRTALEAWLDAEIKRVA